MKNFLIAGTTFVTFTVSMITPVQAGEVARLDGQKVSIVQNAMKDYPQKHNMTFNNIGLEKADADFVEGLLLTNEQLPSLSMDQGKVYLDINGERVEIAMQGLKADSFLINGKLFTYNKSKSLEQNAVAIRQLLLTREVGLLDGLFVPSAEAEITTMGAVLITAAVAAVVLWMVVSNKNKEIAEVKDKAAKGKEMNASLREDNSNLASRNYNLRNEIYNRNQSRESHYETYHSGTSSDSSSSEAI
ncbi:MAG: hypothetical protein KA116_07635 [Proteobacteria bacterium]|nr:hypothetical protein [Pseudomonadota bacterium]